MIAAQADKSDLLAIGRPFSLLCVAADESEFLRLLLAINAGQPDFFLRRPQCPVAVGRDLDVFAAFFRTAHFAQQSRLSIARIHLLSEHLLLDFNRAALRIGAFFFFIQLAAAGKKDRLSVRRELETGDGHAVIGVVVSHLSRGGCEVGALGDPNIAHAFAVENPGDAVAALGGGQSRREWRTQNLFQREGRLRVDSRQQS